MRPPIWNPPIELSVEEQKVAKRIRKAKLFLFLRQNRHILFDADFQEELANLLYKDSTVGKCPVPPAQLALCIILQAYTGVSDDEAIEAIVMDRRWQLNQVETWITEQSNLDESTKELVEKNLATARLIEAQDVEIGADGYPKLRQGVAVNRQISIEDDQMRHGRKSRSQRFDGYG